MVRKGKHISKITHTTHTYMRRQHHFINLSHTPNDTPHLGENIKEKFDPFGYSFHAVIDISY